jgi:phasin
MVNPTDPFSASIIPFEVPEQMRALAEKGVSQARDNYAKFKDVAESQNSTIEAVFASASKGASEFSAKLMEATKANTTATLDFAQELIGVKTPSEALELWTAFARKPLPPIARNSPSCRRKLRPKPPSRSRPAPPSCSSRPPEPIASLPNARSRRGRAFCLPWHRGGQGAALPKRGVAPIAFGAKWAAFASRKRVQT